MIWPRRHRTLALGLLCLIFTLLCGALYWAETALVGRGIPPILLLRTENFAKDFLQRTGRKTPVDANLVYLGIGDSSMKLKGLSEEEIAASKSLRLMQADWPWDRSVYQAIIDRLAAAGARAVLIDLLFLSPKAGDEQLQDALERHGDRVVLGSNFVKGTPDAGNVTTTLSLPAASLIPPSELPDRRIGFVNHFADADGILRRVRYQVTLEDFGTPTGAEAPQAYDSLAAATLRKIGRPDLIPGQTPMVIRFAGPAGTFRPHPVFEIFLPSFWQANYQGGAFFKDKIVIVGPEGNFQQDAHPTALDEAMPGAEIHLNALNAALHRDFLRETSPGSDLVTICLAGLVAWLAGVCIRQPSLRLFVLMAVGGAYLLVLWFLYNRQGLLTISITPLLTLGSSGIACFFYDLVLTGFEKRELRRTLERYVSKDVVSELLDKRQSYLTSLIGVRKDIAILFSDVRNFTSMAESADPHVLVAQLNEYFNVMVGIVFAHHGTLDKFIGDAVMAHWGSIATAGAETDARRAVSTALEMRAALVRLNAGWKARSLPQLAVGCGVNFGDAIVGNLGCEAKMEVSVLGDAVNLGSRLESVTKEYGLDLCLGESIAPLVRDAFILRSVDLIIVKGKTRPVEVFTALAARQPGLAEPAWLARHEEAVRAYRRGDFDTAEAAWRDVLAAEPGDALASVFLARCATLRENPPAGGWTGVFTMRSK